MIGLDSEIFCQNCTNEFNDNNLPRMLTMCGHTYCQNCITKMITQSQQLIETQYSKSFFVQCPDDGLKMTLLSKDIKIFPKNLALIKVLESKKQNSSFKDQFFNLSKIVKQQQIAEDLSSDQLINAMNEAKQFQTQSSQKIQLVSENEIKQSQNQQSTMNNKKTKQSKKVQQNHQLQQLCLLHQKPLQIVCLNDQQKICSKCAIFGQHKGHDFKGIQQVQNQTNTCYMKILKIFQEKQEIQKRMSNTQTQTALIDILIKKRDILQKQVRQQFRKLRQQITSQEKKVLKRLSQTYKNTQSKIKSLLKIDQKITQQYHNFYTQSFQIIKVLEAKQIQSKIDLLYSKDKDNLKILKTGQKILKDLKNQENNLIGKVEQILSTLQCKQNKKIYEKIYDFIEIINEPKKNQIAQKPFEIIRKSAKSVSQVVNTNKPIYSDTKPSKFLMMQTKQQQSSLEGSPLLQQSLLDIQQNESKQTLQDQQIKVQIFNPTFEQRYKPLSINQNIVNKQHHEKSISSNFINLGLESVRKFPKLQLSNYKKMNADLDQSFISNHRTSIISTKRQSIIPKMMENDDRPNKKKLKSIKVSQKYQKILDGIYNNTLDTIDLTNGEIGDQNMLQICQFVKYSKARTIKFIRNKLTDSGIQKMLPMLSNAQILNLSQNNLTQNVLDVFIANRYGCLSGLKNLILSQNKIIQRKHKAKIDQLRAMNLTVSV